MEEIKDFAKIVRSTDGRQVLYYLEPECGSFTLHQVVPFDGYQVDMKIVFTSSDDEGNEKAAFTAFDLMEQQQADNCISLIKKMMNCDEL